jgi:Fe-S-cluster containining protein
VGYVYLNRDESKRMKRLGLSVVQQSGNSFLGTRAGAGAGTELVCVAFRGKVGGECACSIYAARPRACRGFEVGSPLCKEARENAGLPI